MADPSETTQVSREQATGQDELLEAVRSLETHVGSLETEVRALRTQAPSLPSGDGERPGWEDGAPVVRDTAAWVRTIDSPSGRRLAVPWLLLEILFLVTVAALAAIADLDAPAVVAVMVVAWALVAVAEWLTSRAASREQALLASSFTYAPATSNDPAWLAPPSEQTALEQTALELEDAADRTTTRLPPPQAE